MHLSRSFAEHIAHHFDWTGWEALIEQNGITIDRPRGSRHPRFETIIYPIDYGYVNGTTSSDGAEVDVFVGTARTGLSAVLITEDHWQGDREFNLIYNCTPAEIYLSHGFVNYDQRLLEGWLAMRRPLHTLWEET